MNKILTMSLVAALGLVGGGAYMLVDSDKNFSEYVPEPVTALLGDYLPDNFKVEASQDTVVVVEEVTRISEDSIQMEQEVQHAAPQVERVEEVIEENTQPVVGQKIEQVINQPVEQTVEQDVFELSDENVVEIAMQEIQKSLSEVTTPLDVANSNPKAKMIEKKIVAVSTKISKLDMENKELEEKFQNILRENRNLAKKLQAIDKQLANTN